MDSGTSLLIDLASHQFGQPAGRAIGASYLLKHWAALGERERRDHVHVVLVDEAHVFSYGPLPTLLGEARKFGVGIVVATQHLGQLTGELADALESNTGTFISLRAGLQSAQRAPAKLMGWPTSDLVRLPGLTGAMSMSRDGVLTAPFSLHIDHHDRMRQLAKKGLVGAEVAEGIVAGSRGEVARRFDNLRPITDAELMRRLTTPIPEPSGLDAWLARRATTPSSRVVEPPQGSRPSAGPRTSSRRAQVQCGIGREDVGTSSHQGEPHVPQAFGHHDQAPRPRLRRPRRPPH